MKKSALFISIFILALSSYSQEIACEVVVDEIKNHLGETVIFCGLVTDAAEPYGIEGNHIFLNFGGTYLNHKFTVANWEDVHKQFDQPPIRLFFPLTLQESSQIIPL